MLNEAEMKEFGQLLADDLEAGHLEKVIALFRYNRTLYGVVGNLLKDERMRVRLGVHMVIDELAEEKPEDVSLAVPALLPLLDDERPTVRGDAADLLGVVGDAALIPDLNRLLADDHPQVAEIAAEAIEEIKKKTALFS